jgi:hypothetical protein
LHGRLLLPAAYALPDLCALRRRLRLLLPAVDAVPDVHALRRHLRALLPAADDLHLHASGAPLRLLYAIVR